MSYRHLSKGVRIATNKNEIKFSIYLLPSIGIPRQIFVLTDGEVGNTNECIEFVRKNAGFFFFLFSFFSFLFSLFFFLFSFFLFSFYVRFNNFIILLEKTRVFAFGIGYDVSEALVQGIADAGDGAAELIKGNENIESKVMTQLERALKPALTDVLISVLFI